MFLDYGLFRVCDRVSGWPIDLSSLSDVQFAVDPDLSEDDPDRMSSKAVEQLYTLIYPRAHLYTKRYVTSEPTPEPRLTYIQKTGWLIDGPNIPGRPFWVMRHRTPLLT